MATATYEGEIRNEQHKREKDDKAKARSTVEGNKDINMAAAFYG